MRTGAPTFLVSENMLQHVSTTRNRGYWNSFYFHAKSRGCCKKSKVFWCADRSQPQLLRSSNESTTTVKIAVRTPFQVICNSWTSIPFSELLEVDPIDRSVQSAIVSKFCGMRNHTSRRGWRMASTVSVWQESWCENSSNLLSTFSYPV